MDKAMQWLGGLLMVLVLAVAVPIGVAVATDWTPAQTNAAMTGLFSVCGGSVALLALGLGLSVGIGATRARSGGDSEPRGGGRSVQVVSQVDYLRQQKQEVDLQRALLALERDRRGLLPAPQQEPEADPTEQWLAQMPAWEFVDAAQQ